MTTRAAGLFGFGLLLAACSGSAPREPGTAVEPDGAPGCFNIRDVQDFRVIDRSRLIVFAPNESRAFQVRIAPPSSDLRNALFIRFEARGGRVCGRAGESIYFDGPGAVRYAVTDVTRLDGVPAAAGGTERMEPGNDTAADIEPLADPDDDRTADQPETGEP